MTINPNSTPPNDFVQQTIERFWQTIPPIWNQVKGNVRKVALEQFDISVEQFHVLRHIHNGVCSVSEIAEVKQISRPAVSQAVDILVERGLIQRRQDTNDRRIVQLELTENGAQVLKSIQQTNRRWMMERLSGLDDAELQQISKALETLHSTFFESLLAERQA